MITPTQSSTPKPCPECGGERIYSSLSQAMVFIPGGDGKARDYLLACVCSTCGYTTLYVSNPEKFVKQPLGSVT